MKIRKNPVDLTDLAIGIIILGLVASIGAYILLGVRDARLTDLPVLTTANETVTPSAYFELANAWGVSVGTVTNATGAQIIASTDYTSTVNPTSGIIEMSNSTSTSLRNVSDDDWNVSYTRYDITRADWDLPNNASIGLAEYGNWFKIIIIVGIAGLILALLFLAFGNKGSGEIGGTY